MTLIASYINKYGIVLASDSNLTSRIGNSGFGQKIFSIPYLNSGIAYSGLYNINGIDIDEWMKNFILNESFIYSDIMSFVSNLTKTLNQEYKGEENDIAIMHICGYSKIENNSYCEHWHISNGKLGSDGNYSSSGNFDFHNDFNTLNSLDDRMKLQNFDLHSNNNQFYLNGFPPARVCLMVIRQQLEALIVEITKSQSWSFRPPNNLFESSNYVKMYFNLIGELFKMSDYQALFVGGETQTILIPAPYDLNKTID